jgi:hypothetical protein
MHWQIVLGVLFVMALILIPVAGVWVLNIFGTCPVTPRNKTLPLCAPWRKDKEYGKK